jgi:hypothetical protein
LAHVHSHVRDHSHFHDQHDAHHHHDRDLRHGAGGKCGAPDRTPQEVDTEKRMVETWLKLGGARRLQGTGAIVVPVCFHVIRHSEDTFLDTDTLQVQLDALNVAFSTDSCCDTALDWW